MNYGRYAWYRELDELKEQKPKSYEILRETVTAKACEQRYKDGIIQKMDSGENMDWEATWKLWEDTIWQ